MANSVQKIEELTQAQKDLFPVWVEKYTKIGLSCDPADRSRAERGIRAHYVVSKIPEPRVIVWTSHPMVTVSAGPMASTILDKIRDVQTTYPPAKMAEMIRSASFDGMEDEVIAAVTEILEGLGYTADESAPLEMFASDLAAAVKAQWHQVLGGAWWISYVAWATYVRDVLSVDVPIGPREDTDTSCGWWWPHTEFTVVTDRPAFLHRDTNGQLHSQTGPAISWRNGKGMYFWHGVRVPGEWIEATDKMDPMIALNHPNIELRRCAAEIMGWIKVLGHLDPKTINTDVDPQIGTLLEVTLGETKERFLKVVCGTGRTFVLPVPPTMTTALEANAWTYGIDPVDLKSLEART